MGFDNRKRSAFSRQLSAKPRRDRKQMTLVRVENRAKSRIFLVWLIAES
jgi:hypothetical protein